MKWCEKEYLSKEWMYCGGVLDGVFSTLHILTQVGGINPQGSVAKVCGSVKPGQLRQEFIKWARTNPKNLGAPEVVGVMTAIFERWRCK